MTEAQKSEEKAIFDAARRLEEELENEEQEMLKLAIELRRSMWS